MHKAGKDVEQLLPLKPADFEILLALAAGELHGYAIMKEVEKQSEGTVRLEVGSMYRMLGRMISRGLIAEADAPEGEAPPSGRRRYFKITETGIAAARAEARRLKTALKTASAHRLLEHEAGRDV
ncbi:MAG TPA: helix-turn-helix transcriptional regulator [Acidobacteriota bacterium]|nr:helix-turn-helix transcriptional regulator [Acidobacteriota bacterium]